MIMRELVTMTIQKLIKNSENANNFGYVLTEELFDPENIYYKLKEELKNEADLSKLYEYRITIKYQNIELYKTSIVAELSEEHMNSIRKDALPHEFFPPEQVDTVWVRLLLEMVNVGICSKMLASTGRMVLQVKETTKPVTADVPIFGGPSSLKTVN